LALAIREGRPSPECPNEVAGTQLTQRQHELWLGATRDVMHAAAL